MIPVLTFMLLIFLFIILNQGVTSGSVRNALSLISGAAALLETSKPHILSLTNCHKHLGQKLSCLFQVGKVGQG